MKKRFTSYTTSLAARPRSRRLRELGVAAAVAVSGATAASGGLSIDDLFEKVENGTNADGNIKWAIRAKYGLFSTEFIATRGTSDDSGASGGGIDVTFLEDYLAGKSYATESWVSDKLMNYWTKAESDNRYLSQHQDISHLLSKTDAASLYQPKGNYLTQHQSLDRLVVNNTTMSSCLQFMQKSSGWNEWEAPSQEWYSVLKLNHGDGDTYYSRSIAFSFNNLRVYVGGVHNGKSLKSNTLAFLSDIPDAYTKAEADGRYVDLSSNQAVGGTKTFTATVAGNYGFRSDGATDRLPWFEWHIPGVNYTKAMMTSDGVIHFVNGADTVPTRYNSVKAWQLQLAAAQGTAPLIVSSQTVVTNLNADLLDGVHNGHLTANRLGNRAYISDLNSPSWNTLGLTYCLFDRNAKNAPATVDNANGVLNISAGTHATSGEYGGQLAFHNNGKLYWRGWAAGTPSKWHTIAYLEDVYTKSEADGRYVNADGDDMTGVLTITTDTSGALNLKTETANAAPFMRFWQVGNAKTSVGWDSSNGSYIFNYASQKQLGIKDDGTPHFNGNKLWHSGNDGSGSGLDADLLDGHHESEYFRNNIAVIAPGDVMTKLPGNRSGSYQVSSSGWYGSATVFYTGGSNSGLAFYRPGGSNSVPRILVATDSKSNWVDKGVILTSAQLANSTDIAAFTDSGFYWTATDSDSATLTNSPFSTTFAMITQTCYNSGTDLRRSRVAWDSYGAMKVFDDRSIAGTPGTWYDVLTGKNYSSILDQRYVTKADLAEMFTIVTEGGKKSIKAMMGLWSADWIATKGQSESGGTSGAGIDVTFLESYLKGDNADKAVYATQSWVGSAIDSKLTTYATQSWVNSQGFLKSHQSLANYVTLNTAQTITGMKTFSSDIMMGDSTVNGCMIKWVRNTDWAQIWFKNASDSDTDSYLGFQTGDNGNEYFRFSTKMSGSSADTVWATIKSGGITANGFIKSGGTATQALMADGSVRTVHTLSEVTNLGWSGTSGQLATINTLAYWDGAYQGVGSNLRYCSHGRFGSIVTMGSGDYVRAYGTSNDNIDSDWGQSIKTFDPIPAGTPPEQNPNVTLLSLGNGWARRKQLAFTYNNDNIYYRRRVDSGFTSWVKLLHTGNYESILNALYYTEAEVNSLVGAKVSKAGDTMTGNLLMSNGSAVIGVTDGSQQDNQYGYVNVMRSASADKLSCFSMVRSGVIAFGLGYTTANQIILGQAMPGKTIIPWLNINLDRSAANRFVSTVGTGTQPFACNSTTCNTNLNADLLDGYHKESFESRHVTVIDARNLDENTWYPVVMPLGNSEQTRIRIEGNALAPATWNGRGDKSMSVIVDYTVNGSMWGWTSVQRVFHHVQFGAGANDSVVCGAGQLDHNSAEYIFVRGGAQYRFVTSRWITPTLYTSTYTGSGQTIAPTTTRPATIARTNAWITDNVASATKLQSARSIWGRNFDGTGNVSGNMTGVGSIHSSLGITKNPADVNSPVHSTAYWYGLSFGDTDTNIVRLGGYYGLHLFTASGTLMMGTSGNVGIGTTAPAYKLDVNGTISAVAMRTGGSFFLSRDGTLKIYTKDSTYGSETVCLQTCIDGADGETHDYVTSQAGRCIMALQPRGGRVTVGNIAASEYALTATSFLCGSWVRTTGDTGWYNQTHQGGWYMSDSHWIRNHNNKSLYMNTATIRTDGRIEVGSSGEKFLVDKDGNVTSTASMKVVKSAAVKNVLIDGDVSVWGNSTLKVGWSNAFPTDVDIYFGKHTAFSGNVFFNGSSTKGLQLSAGADFIGFFYQNNRSYQSDLMRLRYDGTVEIPGNLRLEGAEAYGNRLNFGDGDYVYLEETEDDELHIYANNGIYFDANGGSVELKNDTELYFQGIGSLSPNAAMKAIRCSCGFYSDKFISTKGTADTSDMRFKRVVGSVDLTVTQIAEAPLFTFEWRDEEAPGVFVGTSAQYWEKVLPQSVIRLNDRRHLFYGELALAGSIVNSRAIERMTARYDRWLGKHETRVQRLERRVRELEKELETLKNKEYAA